ncbi:methylmalonyl-CoA epimerase [Geoglobus ahangari]|uniref:Methylmalonyl-CoA epimerase n=1 Tax=Geoglobus ahangari TaxID=113653 RepID=A0A0F7DBI1_9EURY|nr:methylmalonyl-CoA epimerase [Geoglobus ahangari]AKG91131.1 methylmalonyl-CoA epimerase [Geoglobus ahangari]NOY11699.1 methylmalonyl-CoA epimerase [Archaeoglobi archaeon]
MMKKIDHIGIAVKSLDEAVELYKKLGFEVKEIEEVEEQKVKVAMLPVGESKIELLEATSPESAIAKFIEKRGEGIHHIAVNVENIEEALENAKKNGLQLIDEKPRIGAGGKKVAFIHPKSTKGVLLEFVEG